MLKRVSCSCLKWPRWLFEVRVGSMSDSTRLFSPQEIPLALPSPYRGFAMFPKPGYSTDVSGKLLCACGEDCVLPRLTRSNTSAILRIDLPSEKIDADRIWRYDRHTPKNARLPKSRNDSALSEEHRFSGRSGEAVESSQSEHTDPFGTGIRSGGPAESVRFVAAEPPLRAGTITVEFSAEEGAGEVR